MLDRTASSPRPSPPEGEEPRRDWRLYSRTFYRYDTPSGAWRRIRFEPPHVGSYSRGGEGLDMPCSRRVSRWGSEKPGAAALISELAGSKAACKVQGHRV